MLSTLVHAQYSVGVSVGDWAVYSLSGDLTENAVSSKILVTSISGTNVTTSSTDTYDNGTMKTDILWIDVLTGANNAPPNFLFLVSPGLGPGDSVYQSSQLKIESKQNSSYAGAIRSVAVASNVGSGQVGTVYYWDSEKGIFNELLSTHFGQSGQITVGVHAVISQTNLWSASVNPPPPASPDNLPIVVAALAGLIGGVGFFLLIHRRRKS